MAKKYSLTEEHKAQLAPWANRWIANAMSTAAMTEDERSICREAVAGLYAAANLPAPKNIVFVPSPFVLRFAGGFASAIWWLRKDQRSVTYDATRAATSDATLAATSDATRDATYDATRAAIRDATRDATQAATRAATSGATLAATSGATLAATLAATYDATRAATRDATQAATYDAIHAATRNATSGATHAATSAATYDATSDATHAAAYAATQVTADSDWWAFDVEAALTLSRRLGLGEFGLQCAAVIHRMWQGGNQWSAFDSFLSFFRVVVGLDLPVYDKYVYWERLAEHSGPRIVHPDFCVISDRPERLLVDENNRPHCDDGPFCRWRDGSALYAVHGVRVPAWVIERPEAFTAGSINKEENEEVRRVMIERFGWPRYLKEAEAKARDRRFNERDKQSETLFGLADGTQRVLLTDPSTGRQYALGVPAEVASCEQAQAWLSHGLDRRAAHRS